MGIQVIDKAYFIENYATARTLHIELGKPVPKLGQRRSGGSNTIVSTVTGAWLAQTKGVLGPPPNRSAQEPIAPFSPYEIYTRLNCFLQFISHLDDISSWKYL